MSVKVLHINFSDSGGAAIASMDLHEALLKKGVHSRYLCLNLTKEHPAELHYYSHRRIYTSAFRKAWHLYLKAAWINRKNEQLHNLIPEPNDPITLPYSSFDITLDPLYEEADVIHLHWTARFLDWPSFFRKTKKPVVWTLHDRNPFSGILHCATDFPKEGDDREEKIKKLKKEWLKNSTIHVVGPSEHYTELSQRSEVLGKFPHSTIYHGIPQEIFLPLEKVTCREKLGLRKEKKIILSVASDIKRKLKGFGELLEFATAHPELFFVFIGKKDPTAPELANVRYTGVIDDRNELNQWYNAADLTVSNSLEESFGLTVAESLMAGSPVVSKPVGIANDPELGVGIIREINELPDILTSMPKAGSVSHHFSTDTCAEKYLEIYRKILDRP
ncbi:MAG: glycosyltransferase [Bacteroidetes bacterium]|nr:MAG: glycosyltransferase [Bacteroidota bacterium]